MTETTSQSSEKPWAQTAARVGWAILIVATLYVCYFSHLGAIGFVGPDEPRYAWVARDMVETGDWVTPRLYGKPWFEKPPLYYWGAALCFKLFGVSEAAARLPSAISALLATLAMAWLALRLYGAETARWLLLLLPTTVGMIGLSHAAATDMPFSGMLTVAMVAAAVVLDLTRGENTPIILRTPWLALILFGVFLGAAVLAKGPAAIILCGGAVFFWALFTKRWRDAFRLLHPTAIAAFCLTVLPWYILCAHRNPDFFRVFIVEHNFKRYLTPEFQHIQPFWYYGPILLLSVLPWTAILLWTAFTSGLNYCRTRKFDACTLLIWTCAAFCLFFFSFSKSKLPGYILPAIPFFGFVMSKSANATWASGRKSLYSSLYCCALLLIALGFLLDLTRLRLPKMDSFAQQGVAVLLLFLSLPSLFLGCGLSSRRRPWASTVGLALAALWICVPLSLVAGHFLVFVDHDNSPRYLSNRIIALGLTPDVHTYGVNRSWAYGLDFYLHHEISEWRESTPGEAYIVTSIEEREALSEKGFPIQLVEFGRSGSTRQNLSLYRVIRPAASGQPAP